MWDIREPGPGDRLHGEGAAGAPGSSGHRVKQPPQCSFSRQSSVLSPACGQGDCEHEPRPPAELLDWGSLMGSPQGPCAGWQDGKDPVALAGGEQPGHFENHLRHFCAVGALSLLVLPKVPGDGQRPGSQTQEAGAGTGSEHSGQPRQGTGAPAKVGRAACWPGPGRARPPLRFAQTCISRRRGCV